MSLEEPLRRTLALEIRAVPVGAPQLKLIVSAYLAAGPGARLVIREREWGSYDALIVMEGQERTASRQSVDPETAALLEPLAAPGGEDNPAGPRGVQQIGRAMMELLDASESLRAALVAELGDVGDGEVLAPLDQAIGPVWDAIDRSLERRKRLQPDPVGAILA